MRTLDNFQKKKLTNQLNRGALIYKYKMADEDQLSRLAREEILKETRRASVRANEVGSLGWMKCPLPSTNKTFIRNTILATLPSIKQGKVAVKRAPQSDQINSDEKSKRKRPNNEETPSKTSINNREQSNNETEHRSRHKNKKRKVDKR